MRRRDDGGGVSDELNFVLQARREKLDALEARGRRAVRVLASTARTRAAEAQRRCLRRSGGRARRCASPAASSRGARTARRRSRTSPTRSGRIQLYFRKDELGDDAFAHARRCSTSATSSACAGRSSARAPAK